MQISAITIGTVDQQQSIAFYTQLLRCEPECDRYGVAYFKLQGSWLALYPRADLAKYCGVEDRPPSEEGFRALTMSINVASRSEVDAAVGRAIDAGARVVQAPNEANWGGYVAWIADPQEHLWEFVFNPKRAIE